MPRSTVSLGSFPAYCGLTSSTQSAGDYFTGIYVLPQIFCVLLVPCTICLEPVMMVMVNLTQSDSDHKDEAEYFLILQVHWDKVAIPRQRSSKIFRYTVQQGIFQPYLKAARNISEILIFVAVEKIEVKFSLKFFVRCLEV